MEVSVDIWKSQKKREDYWQLVFSIQDIVIEEGKTVEDYRSEVFKATAGGLQFDRRDI